MRRLSLESEIFMREAGSNFARISWTCKIRKLWESFFADQLTRSNARRMHIHVYLQGE